MATTLKKYLLVMVAALSLIVMPSAANAAYIQLYCNKDGTSGGQFYYADQTASQGFCQYQGIQHVFSQIICNFVLILNNVLGQAYCGIQSSMVPILAALLSLYVVVFGAQILMGMAQLNSKEILVRLLQIAGVWVFATQATWGISYIFQFFFGVATQGSTWVINAISPAIPTILGNGADNSLCGASGASVIANGAMATYQYIDMLICNAVTGPFTVANSKVIGFFLVIMFFFPALFMMAATWALTTLAMLARTLKDFLLCLSAIVFLIALSSIFLSFLLFEKTRHLFEEWLRYLVSYSLQIVIVFAIISLWIIAMSLFAGFFNELANLIVPYQHVLITNMFSPDNTFGICQYTVSYSPPGNPGQACVAGLPCMPSLQCDGSGTVIPPSQLTFDETFIYFMAYNLTALLIIAKMFGILIENAPGIARQLSGGSNVPPLAGGFGMSGVGQAGGGMGSVQQLAGGTGNAARDFVNNIRRMLTGHGNPQS